MTSITFIAGTYQPERCGVAHYTSKLREVLINYNIETAVLTTHEAAKIVKNSTVKGVVKDWGISDLFKLVHAVKTNNTDILHIQHAAGTYGFQRPIFLLPLLLRLSGYKQPIVTTIHEYGWWEWEPNLIPLKLLESLKEWGQNWKWWDREDGFLLTKSNAIVTTNADAESVILQRLPYLKDSLYQIPIGANIEVAPIDNLSVRQQYSWNEDSLVIAFFGFLHPVKGLETLLVAFKQLLVKQLDVKLLLIGGVESLALRGEEAKRYWEKIQNLIEELDLKQSVQMTGYLDANTASQYLSNADIGVLPFNHGVTVKSGSLLALFAHKLPVIATYPKVPDPELNTDLLSLIPPRNVDALVTALEELIVDEKKRDRLSTSAYTFVQQFSWDAIAQQHLKIYRRLTTDDNLITFRKGL